MTDLNPNLETIGGVLQRLQTLTRSPEQDWAINALVQGGMDIRTLDLARVKRIFAGESFTRDYHLIFRDKTDRRWVVSRAGQVMLSGRTQWEIIP